jgi:metal-dependent hydrolase (beta-lactamase superfamily II)
MLARKVGVMQHGACQLLLGKRGCAHPGACKLAKECVRTFGSEVAVLSVEVRGTVHRIGTGSGELRSAGEEVETV